MLESLLYFIYVLAAVGVSIYAISWILLRQKIDFKSYSLLNLTLLYFFVPLFIHTTGDGVSPNFSTYGFENRTDLFLIFLPFAVGSILFFSIAYSASIPSRYSIKFLVPSPLTLTSILTLIGLMCWIGYVQLYGGFDYVLSNISQIRSGTDENKNYVGAILRIFSDFLVFAAFFAFSHYQQKTQWMLPVFILLFFLVLFKLFLDGGRGGLINFFVGLYFISVLSSGRVRIFFVMLLLTLAYFVGIYGKIFLFALFTDTPVDALLINATDVSGGLHNIVSEYSHQYLSMLIALENSSIFTDRYGVDFIVWLLKPLKLLGIDVPDSISYYNTYLITGIWDSEVPPGILALGFYNFGVFFFWIPIFMWGLVCSALDKTFIRSNSAGDPNVRAFHAVLFVFLPFGLMNSDPALLFQWLIAVFCLIFFLRVFKFFRFSSMVRVT